MIDISVIIPIYKGKVYLSYWVDILSKNFRAYYMKYKSYCEAVFVNDYAEEEIKLQNCDRYMALYNLKENRGIHGARVFGYHMAKGIYIVFLDQDDKITEDYLISQMENIGEADAVVCNGYRERLWMRGKRAIYTQNKQLEQIKDKNNIFTKRNEICSPGQVLIKKDSIPDLWIAEIMKKNGADDYFLWILMRKERNVFEINYQRIYTHVEYVNNTSGNTEEMTSSVLEMISIMEKHRVLNCNELEEMREIINKDNSGSYRMKIIKIYDFWMYLNIRGRRIEDYLLDHNYKKIAIYGMNYLGNRLYDELYGGNIEIVFGIDSEADGIEYDIPVLKIDAPEFVQKIEKVDAIIITVVSLYQRILYDLQEKCDKPSIPMEEILIEMMELSKTSKL